MSFTQGAIAVWLAATMTTATTSTEVTKIHVVFSNHLDVGFNERSWNDGTGGPERCEGLFSPNGERCMPLAANVTSEYFNVFFPRAAAMADAARTAGGDRYIYMAQPWVVALFLDCAKSGVNDWRVGHTSDLLLSCPNATTIAQFKAAVAQGDIFFQAFPHSSCPESYDASQFEASLAISSRLADELGVGRPRTFSQRDETGMSRAILPLLNKHGVKYISLGSGGSKVGHPVLPGSHTPRKGNMGVFRWVDEASRAEVLMTADHGYGSGLHVLPSGVGLYCAWNRDNSGPSADIFNSTMAMLRSEHPGAHVFASNFDDFFAQAEDERHLLPIVRQEIGDTWLYGIPTDPHKNSEFREVGRRRFACISAGRCDVSSIDFVRFDRLLSLIPEHTWGLDTTFYLGDYGNWSNEQLQENLDRANYQLTIESWQEQRSYVKNAVLNLNTTGPHGTFRSELLDALEALSSTQLAAAREKQIKQLEMEGDLHREFHCKAHAATIAFASDGSVASVKYEKDRIQVGGKLSSDARLGQVRYQTLSEHNFSAFDSLYTGNCLNDKDGATETIGCHNFAKPNMSSAYGGDVFAGWGVHSPSLTKLWRSTDNCAFVTESEFAAPLYTTNGAPQKIFTSVALTATGLELNVSAVNKTASRLPEALWVSFKTATTEPSGWKLRYYGSSDVAPTNVVEHGAVHLHALGPDGSLVYKHANAKEGDSLPAGVEMEIISLDVPVVSAGLLSPFPTALDNSTKDNTTSLIEQWIEEGGWHYNVQNQIWNTNYPQW